MPGYVSSITCKCRGLKLITRHAANGDGTSSNNVNEHKACNTLYELLCCHPGSSASEIKVTQYLKLWRRSIAVGTVLEG